MQGHEDRKEELRNGQEELLAPMLEGGADKNSLKKLTAVITTMNLEASFNTALPAALNKSPEERGVFDKMAVEYLTTQFNDQRAQVDNLINEVKVELDQKVAATQEAERLRDCAQADKDTAEAMMKEATDVKKQATTVLKDSEKAVTTHEKDVKCAADRKIEAEKELEEFQATLAAFEALRDRSNVVEVLKTKNS